LNKEVIKKTIFLAKTSNKEKKEKADEKDD